MATGSEAMKRLIASIVRRPSRTGSLVLTTAMVAWCSLAIPDVVVPTSHLDLAVAIDPVARSLQGTGMLVVPPGPDRIVVLDRRFEMADLRLDGKALVPASGRSGAWILPAATGARRVALRWHGTLDRVDGSIDHRETLTALAPVTGPEGTFAPAGANWYPNVEGMPASWHVTLALPAGQRGLVPGRLTNEHDDAQGYRASFEFTHPADGIDLMAGPYAITERVVQLADRSVRLRTYFAPGLEGLADGYLASTADYLSLYEGWIGPYPYTEFSIVSSPTPTGFGMPTLTYLGADVLRLPFIRATSLGHEVLHNWWGNSVYPDYARGNWSEGLTTFMADYHYKEREGATAARDVRLGWLRDFAAVPDGQDQTLASFTARTHGASQIVGYHKAAMTFSMLRDLIGTEAFDRGVREFWSARQFTIASWSDVRAAFEHASSSDLGWFFSQWIARSGAPRLRIAHAGRQGADGHWRVRVTLAQEGAPYRLQVPVSVEMDGASVTHLVELAAAASTVEFDVAKRPHAIVLDPELRLFRRLGADEAPPILRDAMVNRDTAAVVLPTDNAWTDAARNLLTKLLDGGPRLVEADTTLTAMPLVVIGTAADIAGYRSRIGLTGSSKVGSSGSAQVWVERFGGTVLLFIAARDPASLSALARPLPHYGKQSWLTFEGAKALERGVWPPAAAQWRFD